ncbi:cytidylate kinase-like family protein [Eubacteriales bacterium OttesenSCG-928-M02]|nr:cytidylate kinase-like family protein [Eubacteriales bacterium OttesenSCG-928-M02]
MANIPIITISRAYGSGGRFIGQKLAEQLSIPFYDREIITRSAKNSGLSEGIFERAEEKATSSFLYSLYLHGTMGTAGELPLDEQAFLIQSNIIKDIAKEGPCVIVGRCADYVLRDVENVVNVFIHGKMENRMKRAVTHYHLAEDVAEKEIKKIDKRRATYYRYYTGQIWGDAENYHLSLDSDSVGIEQAVQVIAAFVAAFQNPQHI